MRLGIVARWALVLALLWDQAGSPLHHHVQDSGVDGHASLAAPHVQDEAEGMDLDPHFAHGVLAMRPQFRAAAAVPAVQVAIAHRAVIAPPFPSAIADDVLPESDAGPPGYGSHRSLPPAGRAPPLDA